MRARLLALVAVPPVSLTLVRHGFRRFTVSHRHVRSGILDIHFGFRSLYIEWA